VSKAGAAPADPEIRKAARGRQIDKAQRAWYDERASKSVKQVVPPQGGDRMSTEETIALLMLVIAAIKLGLDLKK
jgi:hypothetical protein